MVRRWNPLVVGKKSADYASSGTDEYAVQTAVSGGSKLLIFGPSQEDK
jgi:hypothetical protein